MDETGPLIALSITLAPTRLLLRCIRLSSHLSCIYLTAAYRLHVSRSCRSWQAETTGDIQASLDGGTVLSWLLDLPDSCAADAFSSATPAAPANRVFYSVKSMQDTARHGHAISSHLQTWRTSPLSTLSIGYVPNEIDVTATGLYMATQQYHSVQRLFNLASMVLTSLAQVLTIGWRDGC